MRIGVLIIILAGVLAPTDQVWGQGCSDAGVCTLYGINPGDGAPENASRLNVLSVGGSYGAGEYGVTAWGALLAFNRSITPELTVSAKLTAASQAGPATTSTGLSDLFFSVNYECIPEAAVTLGVKYPLNDANATLDGKSLPMDYQTSLGTLDLLLGFGYGIGATTLQAAFQQPLSNNENGFLATDYSPGSEFSGIPSTNMYVRRGDVLLRASHRFSLTDRLGVTPGLLPIYHLSDDQYTDEDGVETALTGSKGLTLNGTLFVEFSPGEDGVLELTLGAPFITRESRPDGLTRSFVAGVEYRHGF